MTEFLTLLGIVSSVAGVFALYVGYVVVVLVVSRRATEQGRYFLASGRDRAKFRRRLAFHRRLCRPLFRLASMGRGKDRTTTFASASFHEQGVAFPRGDCTPASVRRALEYRPGPGDVFVVTPMRSGTTWMTHLVHQLLTGGRVDLVAQDVPLHAVTGWLESDLAVPLDMLPRVGSPPRRIIKTHLPAGMLRPRPDARFIYVMRHPADCLASCRDFVRAQLGSLAPDTSAFEDWFTHDDSMWWGSWPRHVAGWVGAAEAGHAVLVVRFEDMVADLSTVVRRVAEFLGEPNPSQAELETMLERCSFEHMRSHREVFAMSAPTLLQSSGGTFGRGPQRGDEDVLRTRIEAQVARECLEAGFAVEAWYPQLARSADAPPRVAPGPHESADDA